MTVDSNTMCDLHPALQHHPTAPPGLLVKSNTSDSEGQFFTPFQHQVAGHGAIRHYSDGRVMKPAIPQEVKFYQALPSLPKLKPFVPGFYGMYKVADVDDGQKSKSQQTQTPQPQSQTAQSQTQPPQTHPQPQPPTPTKVRSPEKPVKNEFIILEDICHGYTNPCMLDLKMGTRHYGENADDQKKERAIRKCQNSTSASLGFRVCGMKVYHPRTQRVLKFDKKFGRSLNENTVVDAFRLFLWDSERMRVELIPHFLDPLRKLLSVVRSLSGYRFYSSSLLLIYDADDHSRSPSLTLSPMAAPQSNAQLTPQTKGAPVFTLPVPIHVDSPEVSPTSSLGDEEAAVPRVDLRMIDFAKTYHHPPMPAAASSSAAAAAALAATTNTEQQQSTDLGLDPDAGFVLGLESVIRCLECILAAENLSPGFLGSRSSSLRPGGAVSDTDRSGASAPSLWWQRFASDDEDEDHINSTASALSRSAVA